MVHQDTDHTHIHFHIQARDINDKKLRFSQQQWRGLHQGWARAYERECGRGRPLVQEHERKIAETRAWKEDRARGIERPSPSRVHLTWSEVEARQIQRSHHEIHQSRTTREVRNSLDREHQVAGRDHALDAALSQQRAAEHSIAARESGVERAVTTVDRVIRELESADQRHQQSTRQAAELTDRPQTQPEREHQLTPGERAAREAVAEISRACEMVRERGTEIAERASELERTYRELDDRAQCRSYER